MSQALDEQHDLLFRLIDGLRIAIAAGSDRETITDFSERVLSYLIMHFATEDRLMLEMNYPDFDAHRKEHDAALAMTTWLEASCRAGEPTAAEDFLKFVEFWAKDHIPNTDERFEEFLACHPRPCAA